MPTSWSRGHSAERRCLSCGGPADTKPVADCPESRHWHRYTVKVRRNAEYRRERRITARSEGTVYRLGRGDMEAKADRERARHRTFRDTLFSRLGVAACERCGFADRRALELDHREGGGRAHRRSLPSGSAYYRALALMRDVELRAMFQVLCSNCNSIKRAEREEWRWRRAGEAPAEPSQGVPASA